MSNRLERAKAWLEANTQIRWTTEFERHDLDYSLDELNRRPNKYAGWLTGFADAEVAKADAKLAKVREYAEFIGKPVQGSLDEFHKGMEAAFLQTGKRLLEILDGSEGR
jgi:hypothetical protein